MRMIFVSVLLGFCAVANGCKRQAEPTVAQPKNDVVENHKPRFTIGEETTYVTGPVDKDGYIDYAAALNARLGKDVTPANNANVLIWKAIGPGPDDKRMPAEFFKLMGMDEPLENGEYFIDLEKFTKFDQQRSNVGYLEMIKFSRQIWTSKESPLTSEWLKANERSLAIAVEATKRTRYFNPLVPARSDKGSSGLFGAQLPGLQRCTALANALASRAMLHAAENRPDEAWKDLIACHRLGRFVGSGSTLIEGIVGNSIDGVAGRADLAFLESAKLDTNGINNCLRDLQSLAPLPTAADKVDLCERFTLLDVVMMTNRRGAGYLEEVTGTKLDDEAIGQLKALFDAINFDPVLKSANHWYNRLTSAARESDREKRDKNFELFESDLKAIKKGSFGSDEFSMALVAAKGDPNARAKMAADLLVSLLIPSARAAQKSYDRGEQTQRNLHIAFALASYLRDNGKYPEKLDALTPKYLAKVPNDYFTGEPLVYRPNEKGYLLYSYGPNGKDDGGKTRDEDVTSDDISLRMPLPEPKGK